MAWSGLVALVLGASIVLGAAPAPAMTLDDLTAAVPDVPGKKWLDLLRQVFPDAAATGVYPNEAKATRMIAVRSLGPAEDKWIMCGDDFDVVSPEVESYRLSGKNRLILLFNGPDECAGIVALFDEKGTLLDAANVKSDRYTVLMGGNVRPLGRSGALLIVESGPDVTGELGRDTTLVLIKAGGFSALGDLRARRVRQCRELNGEGVSVHVTPGGGPMARIEVEMRRYTQQFAEDCKTKLGAEVVKIVTGDWRWNAATGSYEPRLDELKALADWDEKHF
jgi:hypothetical protein